MDLHRKWGESMIAAFAQRGRRKHERPWDGEYAGKWLDAATLTAVIALNLLSSELACIATG